MNISLIGYRGTGKTVISAIIAQQTGLALQNLDAIIRTRAAMSIPEIVSRFGWERFRDLESEVLADFAAIDNQVLDCGGGIVLREQNRVRLKQAGPVIWLDAAVNVIVERIKDDTQRPSLTGKSFIDEIAEVLKQREPLYRVCADHIIRTDRLEPFAAAEQIIRLVGL